MLNIIDTNNFAYHVVIKAVTDGVAQNQKQLERLVQVNAMYLLSGALANTGVGKAKYLFAMDKKPYWRYEPLKELGVIYKGKRGSGSEKYSLFLPLVLTLLESFLAKNGIYLCMYDGYEADDIVATVIQTVDQSTPVTLITSDHDWIPLVDRPETTWLSTRQVTSRVITQKNALEIFKTHKSYNSTVAQRNFPKNHITDLWRWKARFGDSSDNIPQDKECSDKYLPYIDLCNPPTDYDLKLKPKKVKDIYSYITTDRDQITHQQFLKATKAGMLLAITPVGG